MIHIEDKADCCGCTACEAICGHDAITMSRDDQGFVYPVVDESRCVGCSLCDRVCPMITPPAPACKEWEQRYYGMRLRDSEALGRSQSGGAFQALARAMVERGGVVYGVAFGSDLSVRHVRVDDMDALPALYGSKYVQSDMDGIYRDVISDLREGREVLFSGVGCQVAGLVSLCRLRRVDTSRLLTVDLICFGVPGPGYWSDYLASLRRKYGEPVRLFFFRDKAANGWSSSQSSFVLESGRRIVPKRNFYYQILFRRSCSRCPFKGFERCSDITVGDFWGIGDIRPDWKADDRGVSLVLVNTPAGAKAFDSVKDEFEYFSTDREGCIQEQLTVAEPLHPWKDRWERKYASGGFWKATRSLDVLIDHGPLVSLMFRIKNKLRNMFGR